MRKQSEIARRVRLRIQIDQQGRLIRHGEAGRQVHRRRRLADAPLLVHDGHDPAGVLARIGIPADHRGRLAERRFHIPLSGRSERKASVQRLSHRPEKFNKKFHVEQNLWRQHTRRAPALLSGGERSTNVPRGTIREVFAPGRGLPVFGGTAPTARRGKAIIAGYSSSRTGTRSRRPDSPLRFRRWTSSTAIAAGVTPEMRLACPSVRGRIRSSLCLTSAVRWLTPA